jgi:uncharacterized protein (TIGR02246 family)
MSRAGACRVPGAAAPERDCCRAFQVSCRCEPDSPCAFEASVSTFSLEKNLARMYMFSMLLVKRSSGFHLRRQVDKPLQPTSDGPAGTESPPRGGGQVSETEAVRQLIAQQNKRICEWYASGNAAAVAGAFAEDCWQMPPHAEPLVGRAALREFWEQAVQWGQWDFTLETQDVVVAGAIAVERGRYIVRFSPGPAAPPGSAHIEDRGNYVVMWRREPDGQWRAVWDAPVSTVPLQPPRDIAVGPGAAADGDRQRRS